MKNITFKQQFTFNEDVVKGFAVFLGWTEKLTRKKEVVDDDTTTPVTTHFEDEEYDNPQTFTEFIEEKAKEHTLQFTKQYAESLKNNFIESKINELKTSLDTQVHNQIIKPVEDALKSEIIVS